MTSIVLPNGNGRIATYESVRTTVDLRAFAPPASRVVFAAAHVAARANGDSGRAEIDWDATMAFRHHLWKLGFAVAEAMDTSQRGAELAWHQAQDLISRTAAEAVSVGGKVASGAGTDHLDMSVAHSLEEIEAAYLEQIAFVEATGSDAIVMASKALAREATSAEDYLKIYRSILSQIERPVILHWLGEMFDPDLRGYWGSQDPRVAMRTVLQLIESAGDKVDGIKISLLDAALEIQLRNALPAGVRLYTGDDFNFAGLIRGDADGHSDALLGVFDPIAHVAATALEALDRGDVDSYDRLMLPAEELGRVLFEAPTYDYKTGVVFLAYVNGLQDEFVMLGGRHRARSTEHLARVLIHADRSGVLLDPERAFARAAKVIDVG